MALFDPTSMYGNDGPTGWLSALLGADSSNFHGSKKDLEKYMGWPVYSPPPMYTEPYGDPSGSQPLPPQSPYLSNPNMPGQTATVDLGAYTQPPQSQQQPSPLAGVSLSDAIGLLKELLGSQSAKAPPAQAPSQAAQPPQFGAGAQPLPFANMLPGQSSAPSPTGSPVPLPIPRPQAMSQNIPLPISRPQIAQPMAQAPPQPQQQDPYGFANSPAYMGQGSSMGGQPQGGGNDPLAGLKGLIASMFPSGGAQAQAQAPQPPQQPGMAPGMPGSGPGMAPQQPPGQAAAGPSFFERLSAASHNMAAGGGLLPGILDAGQGLMTGQRTDPAGMAQAQLMATYQALVKSGVPEPMAKAAALNPEILKTIAPAYFDTKPTLADGGTDPLTGEKKLFWAQPGKMQLTPATPAGGQAPSSQGSLTGFNEAIKSGITGEALYDYVPAGMKAVVKGMIEGRQQPPAGAAMRNPQTMALIDMAHSIDPTFDATTWGSRSASAKDFSAGKSSEMVRAANQTLHHVGALLDSMDGLKNTQYPSYNAVGNYVNTNILGKGAVTAFKPNAHAVAEEMSKVFKGANLSDAEVRQWEASLNENMSPEQQRAAVGKLAELLNGSLQALQDKRERGMGPIASAKAGPVLNTESQQILERIGKWTAGEQAATPQAAAPPPIVKIGNPTDAAAAYAQAKDAIAKGAPRDGVIARLKQMGLPATGL